MLFYQVIKYLREVNFTTVFGDVVNFDEYGDPAGSYDIVNWQKGPGGGSMRFATVGRFDSSLPEKQQLVLYQDAMVWPGGSKEVKVSSLVLCFLSTNTTSRIQRW